MALIKFSNLVNDIRGATGGNVFARNRAGAYVRNRTMPLNPQSQTQQAARGELSVLAQEWRTLSEEQRAAWNQATADYPYFNKLGEQRFYSGEQLFMTLNRNLQSVGATTLQEPQAPADTPKFTITSVVTEVDAGSGTFNIDYDLSGPASTKYKLLTTRPVSAGISFQGRSEFRKIKAASPSFSQGGSAQLAALYEARFGALSSFVGSKIFIRMLGVNTDTGQVSAPVPTNSVIIDVTP